MNRYCGMKACVIILLILLGSFTTGALGQVSDEAMRHLNRGQAAVELAQNKYDYEEAIREFKEAARLAPDWPDAYYNLGIVQEKAEKYNEAILNLRQYLRLSPDASDAKTVKSLINKLEYKRDKKEGVEKVYDMMASGLYKDDVIGEYKNSGDRGAYWLYMGREFRKVKGILEVHNQWCRFEREHGGSYHPKLHPPIPREWEPVKVNGKYYEYSYCHYMDRASGHVTRHDVQVKGEIISIDPPRVKELITCSVDWGVPIPYRRSTAPPWDDHYRATAEGIVEWKLK